MQSAMLLLILILVSATISRDIVPCFSSTPQICNFQLSINVKDGIMSTPIILLEQNFHDIDNGIGTLRGNKTHGQR